MRKKTIIRKIKITKNIIPKEYYKDNIQNINIETEKKDKKI